MGEVQGFLPYQETTVPKATSGDDMQLNDKSKTQPLTNNGALTAMQNLTQFHDRSQSSFLEPQDNQ